MSLPKQTQIGAAFALVVTAALAFILAGLNDGGAAVAAAHEPRSLWTLATVISRFGLSGYMLVLSAVTAAGALLALRRTRRPGTALRARRLAERALFFFAAIAVSGLVCQALKHLVGRARPRFVETLGAFHFAGPTFRSGFESFPSGHSTTVFAAAMALTLMRPAWGIAAYPAAVLICVSRVFAEAHYPSDALAGALLGTAVAFSVARAFARRDIAFPVSDRLQLLGLGRQAPATPVEERGTRAL